MLPAPSSQGFCARFAPLRGATAVLALVVVLLNLIAIALLPQPVAAGTGPQGTPFVICFGAGSDAKGGEADAPPVSHAGISCGHCLPLGGDAFAAPSETRYVPVEGQALAYAPGLPPFEPVALSFRPHISTAPRAPPIA